MIAKRKKKNTFLGHSHFIRHAIHGAIYFVCPNKIREPFMVIEPNLSFLLFGMLFHGVFYFIPRSEKNYFQMIKRQLST